MASTQMVVDLVDLEGWCPAALQGLRVTYIWPFKLLFTHISHKWVGRSSVIWERTLGNLLCLPFRASAAQMHTHTHAHMCTHTYTHVHAQTHTHLYTHAHAPTCTHTRTYRDSWVCTVRAQRMGTLSKSVCKLLLLSPWISQQESDVSVVQAQGGLSEAPLLGLGISILPTLLAPQTFSLSPVHSGLPRG